jgi:hypothetical protein
MIFLPSLPLLLAAGLSVSPGTSYDPVVPTLEGVLGHAVGAEISSPAEIRTYLEALAAAAPDRTRLVTYAHSEEGRPLQVLVVSGRERMARLEETRAGLQALAHPARLGPGEAESLVEGLPVVVWLLHAVHGDEVSSSDAALALAYHLLAARDDPAVDLVRREALVLIDPLQNPDGRARFLAYHRLARAASPDAEPMAAEHDEPWPGGRTSHYLFDMNRDWFAQTQPETRGRLAVFLEWFPQVVADLHEMGGESTYYFAPPAAPLNPRFVESQRGWLEVLGRAIADRFDGMGVPYFVRETFDSFYPGYGETWPMLHGAVGMTFEQASAGGLVWRREDGTRVTYADGVRHHFVAALTTAEEAARETGAPSAPTCFPLAETPRARGGWPRSSSGRDSTCGRPRKSWCPGTIASRPAASWSRSPRAAAVSSAACSIPTCRWTSPSSRSRTGAGKSASPTSSTT